MIDLYSDEVIFRMQRAGGVSVYCGELLSRAMADPDVRAHILDSGAEIDNLAYSEKGLAAARNGRERWTGLMAQRMLQADLNLDRDATPVVFHGTYFRTARNANAMNVLTVHDFTHQKYLHGKQRVLNNLLKRKTISRADAIICISENTKRDLLEYFPEAAEKRVAVIYNGASDDYHPLEGCAAADKFPELGERPYFLYVGARTSYKNFGFAVDLLRAVSEVDLVVAGGAPLTDGEQAGLADCADRVHYFGGLSNQDLNLLYNNAVALVYPSLYEGFGIPVLEAMKAGCPVIAFDNSSIPEVLGGTGVLLQNDDLAGAAAAVRRLMSDGPYRAELVAAQLDSSKCFSWDSCYEQVKALYEDVLS